MYMTRYRSLDGLRGIAAAAVVASHVAAMTWNPFFDARAPAWWEYALWHMGAPAVDVFFVLSGFVVALSLGRHLRGDGNRMEYVAGRFARLLPVAWMGILLGLVAREWHPMGLPGMGGGMAAYDRAISPQDIVGYTTMLFPVPDATIVNPPLWTLVAEMQAALLMPVILWAVVRFPRAAVPGSVMIGALLAIGTGYGYLANLCAFVIGAWIACNRRTLPKGLRPRALLLAGVGLLGLRHITGSGDPLLHIAGALGAAFIVLLAIKGDGGKLLCSRWAQMLGRISFPLYAVHYPIMTLTLWLLGPYTGPTLGAILSLPASFAAALLVERVVDRNAIALSRHITGR